jgi:hypothetical protein
MTPEVLCRGHRIHYRLTLSCGCMLKVFGRPAPHRVVERRAPECPDQRHQPGSRLWLWELLPPRTSVEVSTVDFDGWEMSRLRNRR